MATTNIHCCTNEKTVKMTENQRKTRQNDLYPILTFCTIFLQPFSVSTLFHEIPLTFCTKTSGFTKWYETRNVKNLFHQPHKMLQKILYTRAVFPDDFFKNPYKHCRKNPYRLKKFRTFFSTWVSN